MENRGTGLTPNRLPAEWMKSKLDMTSPPKQGPSQDIKPTSRDAAPGSYTETMTRARPGSIYGESRTAQTPIPNEVIDVLNDAPGGYITQTIAGGSFATERNQGGGPGNTSKSEGLGQDNSATGFASKTTGKPVKGSTLAKGTI